MTSLDPPPVTRVCVSCFAQLNADARFCTSCGRPTDGPHLVDPMPASDTSDDHFVAVAPGSVPQDQGISGPAPAPSAPSAPPAPTLSGPVATGPAATGPAAPNPVADISAMAGEAKGLIRSLFVLKFEHTIAPRVARFLYALVTIVVSLGAAIMVLAGLGLVVSGKGSGLVFLIVAPLGWLFYVMSARVATEVFLLLFKIEANTRDRNDPA